MLVGQNVPHEKPYTPTAAEHNFLHQYRQRLAAEARNGMNVKQALQAIRSPNLKWA
jgi:hypothetical protein